MLPHRTRLRNDQLTEPPAGRINHGGVVRLKDWRYDGLAG